MKPLAIILSSLFAPSCSVPPPDSQGWTLLTDGGSLEGWQMAGPGAFIVEDGSLKATGGMGLLWFSEASFNDFELSFEWKVADPANNSGVFVRFPDPGDDPCESDTVLVLDVSLIEPPRS